MRAPAVFVSHATALHSMDTQSAMFRALSKALADVPRPRGIVVVSAHWVHRPSSLQDLTATVATGPEAGSWGTTHDHPASGLYGFTYDAPTSSDLAEETRNALTKAGIATRDASGRTGLDHGAWIALHSLFPDRSPAPVVQASLLRLPSLADSVEANLALGRALGSLRGRGIAVVSSGGATHNQEEFRRSYLASGLSLAEAADWSEAARERRRTAAGRAVPFRESAEFDDFLAGCMEKGDMDAIVRFDGQPSALKAHPDPLDGHLLALFVALGAAQGDPAIRIHSGFQHGLSEAAYAWGLPLD
ncbi:Extradiol ring-cleavage dioxygenase, class III enzyme, subunit B [Hyaloraphidium curvatum]|nr:Extradiol ring-cleavage dioxygenase, class III enzyme, subunit B [Hyaloraphidium curvatum]